MRDRDKITTQLGKIKDFHTNKPQRQREREKKNSQFQKRTFVCGNNNSDR